MQPKVIISTDIGGNDKDDAQSLIHALLYADDIDYRGFVATSSDQNGVDGITPMNKIIDAYAKDLPNLREAGDYPDATDMRDLVVQGATPTDWPGPLSEGAKLMIEEARNASPDDPVYLLGWGPIHDIARALYEAPDIVDNVVVYSIAGALQDDDQTAINWLKDAVANNPNYADLFWIDAQESFRGMYVRSGGQNDPSANLDWVRENVDDHGALGDLYFSDFTIDLYGKNSPDGLKMGDTPSLLYLLDDISNDNPAGNSWGGSFQRADIGTNHWVDKSGASLGQYDGAQTVFKHRDEVWGDFADRLDIAADGVPNSSPKLAIPEPEDEDLGPTQTPAPVVETDPIAFEEPTTTPKTTKSTNGNGGDDIIKGGDAAEKIDGGAGDDLILGRGSDDVLDGGAGDDYVAGGGGDDTLIYELAENMGDNDVYLGSRGYDVLQLEVTEAELASNVFKAQLNALEQFIAENADIDTNGGATFEFSEIGLSVRSVEKVEVVVVDGGTSQNAPAEAAEPVQVVAPVEAAAPVPAPTEPDLTQEDIATIAVSGLPIFDDHGNGSGEQMKGGTESDSFYGANGNDVLLGRGGDDDLAGGAGSDFVKGGAGDDQLFYIASQNGDASDLYQGSRGEDTLALFVDEELYASAGFKEDIADFKAFIAENYDTGKNGGKYFEFTSFNLRVQSTENIEVYLYDLG